MAAMKAYSVDLRERIVKFVQAGNSKAEAARRFNVCWRTARRYCKAVREGRLAPKPRPGRKRKFTSGLLQAEVAANPSATLREHAKALGVCQSAVWKRLRQLNITLKKNSCATPSATRSSGGSSAGRSGR